MQQGERAVSDVMGFERKGAVALLTLNRPEKLNALSNELLGAIVGALDRIELDPAMRAVVITGCYCSWIVRSPSFGGQALGRSLDRENASKFVRNTARIARRGRREHGSWQAGAKQGRHGQTTCRTRSGPRRSAVRP